ncbi:4-hydroxy-3-methylbut-2-enyl diphosphate reductase [Burkholderia ubonensis]|uniref:4-hydroxy-3-methylbut-2-enyl diphosphate reductase n=1 Tax=Burkholderia ubonensis TaxID=101571 RepID=UPI00075B54FC|nr:4-hydroxy-3-methylbut-2-enyl diphosphate reductase [Burkholderia ubonensis]KWN69689.1 4-hydroxy-3-methylbut-2-enyl diphosphate reductase [Burkholderia ubonensis]
MRVILAQPRGFCAGVVRAVETVERALAQYGAPVYVRHEIVHNQHVVNSLRANGAVFVEELDAVPDGAVTVFSAHGVAKSVEREAQERQLRVLDATCPLVRKVHQQGRQYVAQDRKVVLIGHAKHPEVIGTLGQIPSDVVLVQSEYDVALLDFPDGTPLAYITQTTLSVDDTRGIIASLKARFPQIVGPETSDICYATQNRQMAVRELARQVEVLLVVGSANSSNSQRLREIAIEAGVPCYLVANGSALQPAWILHASTVGLTAGASAPEVMVEDVIEALRRLALVELAVMPGIEERVVFRLPEELDASKGAGRAKLGSVCNS